jgi:hypothetical protein
MSLTPAHDERIARDERESIELCGKNRGPHDYIPIEWMITATSKRVTRFLCRTCFCNIATMTLLNRYKDISC